VRLSDVFASPRVRTRFTAAQEPDRRKRHDPGVAPKRAVIDGIDAAVVTLVLAADIDAVA
jgi:hypothetical protein